MGKTVYYRPSILKRITAGTRGVIEASAGTGKTFAIEHLVIDLLLSGQCTVDQILVVTFTEKATAELRARVRKALEKILFAASNPEPAEAVTIDENGCQRLERAFYAFDRASIFTIHGFCHRVLTDFAFQSGTLLELQLTDSRAAFHRAFRAELRDNLAVKDATRALLEAWLKGTPDDAKGKTPEDLEALLFEAYRRRYLDSPDFGAREKAAQRLIDNYDGRFLKQSCGRSGLKNNPLSKALDVIENLNQRIAQAGGSVERLLDSLTEVEFKPLVGPILRPTKTQSGVKFSARAQQMAQELDAADTAAKSWEWKLVDLFLAPVARRLQSDKRELGQIDYDDMLAWVSNALKGHGGDALAAALRDRFRIALVDEFQDTDDLQWGIFRTLFVEGGRNRLYLVGDPKQAIYAFRGADVFTYLKARSELTGGGAPAQLIDNFRSTSDLIDACNQIFDQNAPAALFGKSRITYDHPVRCGCPDRKAVDLRAKAITPVILMRYQRADGKGASVAEVRSAIGRHLAEQLWLILNDDAHRIRIEENSAAPRWVGARDIFVLTRTRQESADVGEYLREAGVPFAFYKQDGLFQTSEASYVLDVLRAVAEPHIRSHRLKAWLSPFFEVPLRELAVDEVVPAHPLNERLYEWKALAERQRFAELFAALLHDSGLAARAVFATGSGRQLINYQHIFELLLAAAHTRRLDLAEIIALLEDYIFERALPEVEEPNIQRLESDRDAVSVITVHMSKGLEADVVALFGGFGRIYDRSGVAVYHNDDGERRFAIGKAARNAPGAKVKEEQQGEDSRLLYVALTRAAARLYLPLLPADSTKIEPEGYYAALNRRLRAIEAELHAPKASRLFAVQEVAEPLETSAGPLDRADQIKTWMPPPALMDDRKDSWSEGSFWSLRRARAPLVMRSYTSLRESEEEQRWDIPPEEFKSDLEMPPDDRDLPGGRNVGIFLHEAIEKVAMESFAQSPTLRQWRERDDVKGLFYAAMRRNQVRDQASWFERGTQAVFNTLTAPLAIADGCTIGPLHRCRSVREMEFVYPIPESSHPLLAAGAANGLWTVERGYLKGFVDFVFEHDGLVYFADWKSDQLSSYEPDEIETHVKNHYAIQARIYSIGVVRLLQIRTEQDYQRFGGLLYIFLRGMDGGGRRGIYFHRPAWTEICAYETDLMRTEIGSAAR